MSHGYKINGRPVSKQEWDEHTAKRNALYGNLLEDMFASHSAPVMSGSDRAFLEGTGAQSLTHGMWKVSADKYYERAAKAGINTHGKVYMSQLGTVENPLAWVSGLDDVKKSCELQGHGCEPLGLKPVVKDPGPDIPLAEDIVQREAERKLEADPDLAAHCRENPEKIRELKDSIVDKHGARK